MRVIAGYLGGRVLKAPAGMGTRPTADRAREGIFSIVGPTHEFKVLDLYAGTGALGIEALSRGAVHAIFVENEGHALKCLSENLAALDLTQYSVVVRRPVERAHKDLVDMAPFDLIFCDPPWLTVDSVWRFLGKFDWERWLSPGGQLVLEHPASRKTTVLPFGGLQVSRARSWGDTAVTILRRSSTLEQA